MAQEAKKGVIIMSEGKTDNHELGHNGSRLVCLVPRSKTDIPSMNFNEHGNNHEHHTGAGGRGQPTKQTAQNAQSTSRVKGLQQRAFYLISLSLAADFQVSTGH